MDGEDAFAALHVGTVDDDAAIEAAGAQQRRVEHVGTVGRGDEDDAFVRLEAVHLDEQLIQRLLALVVTAAEAGAAMTADGVDLVDEDDAGRVLLALLEQIADARRADADEHLDEVGAADREERHVGFAGDRAREQRLAGAREGPSAARPSGMRPPSFWNFCGSFRNSMISCSSSFASSTPATSLNVTFFCELDDSFALLLPNDSALLPPLCIWRMKKIQKPIISRNGRPRIEQRRPRAGGRLLRGDRRRRFSISLLTRPSYWLGA